MEFAGSKGIWADCRIQRVQYGIGNRENSSIELKTGISLESRHCWLLQLGWVWFPPQPRQPGRYLLHSPRGPCQDDCARCWALRVIFMVQVRKYCKGIELIDPYWTHLLPSLPCWPVPLHQLGTSPHLHPHLLEACHFALHLHHGLEQGMWFRSRGSFRP